MGRKKNATRRGVLVGLVSIMGLHFGLELGGADATLGYTHHEQESHLDTDTRAIDGPLLQGEPARCIDVACNGDEEACAAFRHAITCSDEDHAPELTVRVSISSELVCGAPGLQAARVKAEMALSLYDADPGADELDPDWLPFDTSLIQRDGVVRSPSEAAEAKGETSASIYTFGIATCLAQQRRVGRAVAERVNEWVADQAPGDEDASPALAQSQ